MGVCALNRLLELDLGYNEIMYCYSLVRTKVGLSYLQIKPNRNYLVTNLPDSSSGKEKHYVSISGPLINPDSEFANSFPVGFGNKASKKVNRGCQLTDIRKKLVHQVWQFPDRVAHTLLQYTPRYKSFISLHKTNIPLSPTGTSSGSEQETSEEEGGDPEPESSRNEAVASSSSESPKPEKSQRTPSTSYSSFSTSDSSKTPSAENIISPDSKSSGEMERNIPSVKDMLKRKALSTSTSPKDKRAKVSDSVDVATGKGSHPEDRPSKPKHIETAKKTEDAKKAATEKNAEGAKNTEAVPNRPPRGNSSEGPHKGLTVWQPKLIRAEQGSSRPILQTDTVEDPLVALGLSDVFLLPKDKNRCQGKPSSQLRELGLSHMGQTVNVVSELHRRCESFEDLLKDAIKKEGAVKSELSKQNEKLRASKKQNEELEGRLKETELRLIKGTRLLTEANEELEKTKAEGRVLTRANSDLKKQVAEFPQKLIAEYNAGAEQAVEKAAKEVLEVLEEQWTDGFRRAWTYALQMANVESASDLFKRCDEARDLTRSKMIGEQAAAELKASSTSASPAINPVATETLNPQVGVSRTNETEVSGAKEQEKQAVVDTPPVNPPA